jgi:hypothetical protein
VSEARVGSGRILRSADLERALARAGIAREPMVDHGLSFARRMDDAGRFYFINNRSDRTVEGWVPVRLAMPAATIFDPMHGRHGAARLRGQVLNSSISQDLAPATEVFLRLDPGESLIVAASARPHREAYEFYAASGPSTSVAGPWRLTFVKGGPTVPAARTVDGLQSWTALAGDDVRAFSGTAAYSATFPRPSGSARQWLLDLGRVHESARVRLNGRDVGTLIGSPYRLVVADSDLKASNALEVLVTNLPANRIADLDRRGVPWKKFYNVNMPSRFPQNRGPDGLFTAATWEPLESGLIGPVTIAPATPMR